MIKWITAQFNKKGSTPEPTKKLVSKPLTKQERLHAILISYKIGRIDLSTAMDFIYVWSIKSDK